MKVGNYRLELKKRRVLRPWQAMLNAVMAIVAALVLFGFIFILAGLNPIDAYQRIFSYAFFNQFGLPLTLNRFVFLLLCTYAFIIPFRAGLWNIGMTGQLYVGALAAYGVFYAFGVNQFNTPHPPAIILLPLAVLGAAVGGAFVGAIAGYLKGKYNTNEIVVTMMLNFMAFWFVSFMIKDGGIFMNAGGRGESFELPDALHMPLLLDVPITIFFALIAGIFLHYLFSRMRLGFEIRAYGQNPNAAAYAGISRFRVPILVFVLGGILAGLAGYHYFGAVPGVYKIARNYAFFGDMAFYGIICGLISQGNPLGAVPVAFLFGGLSVGGRFVQGALGMSFGVDYALLGVLMITLVAFQFFYRYKIVVVNINMEKADVGVLGTKS
ncbi:ABC transporter permease [Candidatus Leptofilum sp.]|uniref:ABC transporter permease n=1 Tax=Candidatus Leptofilum sp. TaxID=3241576 RepID=UPI003B5AB0FE